MFNLLQGHPQLELLFEELSRIAGSEIAVRNAKRSAHIIVIPFGVVLNCGRHRTLQTGVVGQIANRVFV